MALFELECTHTARVVDLTTSGFDVQADGTVFGAPVRNPMFAQVFDQQRVTIAAAPATAREQQLRVRVTGSSIATLTTLLDTLELVCDELTRRGGGWLRHRPTAATGVTRYRVSAAKLSAPEAVGAWFERAYSVVVTIALVVDPYGLKPPMDVTDGFSVDTLGTGGVHNRGGADWTADAGALTNGVVTGGVVDAAANLSTENRWRHTGTGNSWGDVSVQVKHTVGATLTSYKAGVILRRVDASNYVEAYADDTGAASRIRIDKVVAGSRTNLVSTSLTRLVAGTAYWIEANIVGNVVTAEHWTTQPTPMGSDAAQATTTLSGSDATLFGAGVTGGVGVVWAPIETTAALDDFRVRAYAYREVTLPRVLRLEGSVGGTTDALAGVYYTGSGGTAPTVMMLSWWPRVAVHNMVWNGGGEVVGSSATTAYGWSAAAVSGVIAAATSITRTTTAASIRTGSAALEIITPATTDTGASFAIYRAAGFRKGVTYTAQAYVRAASGSTAVRIKLGVSGDLGTGTASNLSTSWSLRTVTWTPTADYDVAYVALGVNAATATTFQVDDVLVFEGTTAPSCELGGFGPGIIPAAAYNSAAASSGGSAWTLSNASATSYLIGWKVTGSGALSTNGNLEFPILPHLFTPDDFAQDEVDVAVFARLEVASTQTSLTATLSLASERGTAYGARRYGSFRSTGKAVKLPSSSTVFKPYYLGRITVKVDRSRPRREWLRVAFTNAGGATGTIGVDHLVVVPARRVAASQRGSSAAIVPQFISSTAETTKVVGVGTAGEVTGMLTGSVVEHANGDAFTPDDGLCGELLRLPQSGVELLVWPSDMVIDLTDSSAATMAKSWTGSVQVAMQPRTNLFAS